MNPASTILKKIDLFTFISQSDAAGTSLRMTATNDGTCSNVISFPACGNWINKPTDPGTMRSTAPALFRAVGAR